MNELTIERQSTCDAIDLQPASMCPMHDMPRQYTELHPEDELYFPMHKRIITQYLTNSMGVTELYLFYGDKEISFDEPELFPFGEQLAQQTQFVAKTAIHWGNGHHWERVKELFELLIAEGILHHANSHEINFTATKSICSISLPPSNCTEARSWSDCESILLELTGRPLELGYLELVVPVSRIAHMALDAEGRQVGEANVFPKALRLNIPTEWHSCPFPGSRFQNERPMNITALKSIRTYWPQIMAVILQIREVYLQRFPHARNGWTVGDLERFSTIVLAIPAYLLMRADNPVQNEQLHPVLSSMFRVTDGVRMTTHQMMFIPIAEPTLADIDPMTSEELFAYAERNYIFQSTYGVCAGPKAMIEEFLKVFIDGYSNQEISSAILEAPVKEALAALKPAFDYGLYGLQAFSIVFSLWLAMTRTYVELWEIVKHWPDNSTNPSNLFKERLKHNTSKLIAEGFLATEEWRKNREQIYTDMYQQSAMGLGINSPEDTLAKRITPRPKKQHRATKKQLYTLLHQKMPSVASLDPQAFENFINCLFKFLLQEQAIVTAACEVQKCINDLLGRTQPKRDFSAADINIYNQLAGDTQGLPYLGQEIADVFAIQIVVTESSIKVFDHLTA